MAYDQHIVLRKMNPDNKRRITHAIMATGLVAASRCTYESIFQAHLREDYEGYVAENRRIFARLSIKQALSMYQSDVFSLLEQYCSRNTDKSALGGPTYRLSHLVLGLELVGDDRSRGVTRGTSAENYDTGGGLKEHDENLLSKILSLAPDSVDLLQPLYTYGVDSLIAVELRNWFQKVLKVDVAVFEILGGAAATTLGRAVAEKLRQQ
ncbi:hypothetical protein SLS62_007675 [Diatrype stigma]|uniref:Carrier domain-containing protein n=1 Tax=Diatrype stigma TaxID=117547 RepID=A0AAN9UNU0_9PEZI